MRHDPAVLFLGDDGCKCGGESAELLGVAALPYLLAVEQLLAGDPLQLAREYPVKYFAELFVDLSACPFPLVELTLE